MPCPILQSEPEDPAFHWLLATYSGVASEVAALSHFVEDRTFDLQSVCIGRTCESPRLKVRVAQDCVSNSKFSFAIGFDWSVLFLETNNLR